MLQFRSHKPPMKISKEIKIELIASQDASRQPIAEPFLDVKDAKGTLVATNGMAMALVPVEIETEDDAGYCSAEVLKAARKSAVRGFPAHIKLNGNATVNDSLTMPRNGKANTSKVNGQSPSRFPNWRQVIPAADRAIGFTVTLDAKLLWTLAQAIGTQAVTLEFENKDARSVNVKPFHMKDAPCACPDARGVLMTIATLKK
jgi:hypothetical protein